MTFNDFNNPTYIILAKILKKGHLGPLIVIKSHQEFDLTSVWLILKITASCWLKTMLSDELY